MWLLWSHYLIALPCRRFPPYSPIPRIPSNCDQAKLPQSSWRLSNAFDCTISSFSMLISLDFLSQLSLLFAIYSTICVGCSCPTPYSTSQSSSHTVSVLDLPSLLPISMSINAFKFGILGSFSSWIQPSFRWIWQKSFPTPCGGKSLISPALVVLKVLYLAWWLSCQCTFFFCCERGGRGNHTST